MKLRIAIVAGLLFARIGLPALAQVAPPTGRALLISDIHFDPLADPAIIPHLVAAPVEQWSSIFEKSRQKSLSAYGADTNYRLLSSTLAAPAAQVTFDYVMFTGDALRYNSPQAFAAVGVT